MVTRCPEDACVLVNRRGREEHLQCKSIERSNCYRRNSPSKPSWIVLNRGTYSTPFVSRSCSQLIEHVVLNSDINFIIFNFKFYPISRAVYIFSYLGRFPLVNLLFERGSGVTGGIPVPL